MPRQDRSQAAEIKRALTCDSLRKSVTAVDGNGVDEFSLYNKQGERKYLNLGERERALRAMTGLSPQYMLFAEVLAWTGARVSEVLALTPQSFQLESGIISITTLKRRKSVVREVPVPPRLMASLNRFFGLRRHQRTDGARSAPLWMFCRMTAWRIIRSVMTTAGISGPQACPKGFRHGFAVCALQSGVPVTVLQKWMGHSRLSTTSIYLNVCGPDEIAFARAFWKRSLPTAKSFNFVNDVPLCA